MRLMPRLPRTIVLLALTSLFADISTEMLYPILPLFLTRDLRAPASIVGLIEGVAQATQYLAQGFSGWFADRAGRNKPIALLGYGLAALAKPTMGLAVAWPAVLAGRFVDRLGSGTRSAPRDALIAAAAGKSRRGVAFGLEGAGDNLGTVAGPLIAAALLFALHLTVRWIFSLAAVPGVVAFALVAPVPETVRHDQPGERPNARSLPPGYWKYLVAAAVSGLGNLSSAFVILRAARAGIPDAQTVLSYAAFNLLAAASSYPAGALSDRLGRKDVLLTGLAILVAADVGLTLAGPAAVVGALFVLSGAYQGIFRAAGKSLATDLAPPRQRATAIGLYSGAVGVAALLASLFGGQLWVSVGPSTTFAYGATLGAIGWILLATLVSETPRG
jgi:MFS family permease